MRRWFASHWQAKGHDLSTIRPRKLPWILNIMSFVGVYRDFASQMKAATSVTALATRRSTFGVIGSWFLGFQADPTPDGGDFWDPNSNLSHTLAKLCGSGVPHKPLFHLEPFNLNQGMALGKSIRCTLLMKLCLCCRDQYHVFAGFSPNSDVWCDLATWSTPRFTTFLWNLGVMVTKASSWSRMLI